jgi:hypothetical protein
MQHGSPQPSGLRESHEPVTHDTVIEGQGQCFLWIALFGSVVLDLVINHTPCRVVDLAFTATPALWRTKSNPILSNHIHHSSLAWSPKLQAEVPPSFDVAVIALELTHNGAFGEYTGGK